MAFVSVNLSEGGVFFCVNYSKTGMLVIGKGVWPFNMLGIIKGCGLCIG